MNVQRMEMCIRDRTSDDLSESDNFNNNFEFPGLTTLINDLHKSKKKVIFTMGKGLSLIHI